MGSPAFNLSIGFESLVCASCGITYAAPGFFFEKRRENHKEFFCPNGHSQYFPGQTEADKLAAQLKDERERHARTLSRLNAEERKAKKLARKVARVEKGVCPCCNRYFVNVARHMATKHPDEKPIPLLAAPLPLPR